MDKIIFNKISNQDIFSSDFENFIENNELEFSNEKICIVYGPNGTGKTSLVKVLNKDKGTEYKLKFHDLEYSSKDDNELFHIVKDQNNRNIISGETSDFLLGDDIKKEHDLRDLVVIERNKFLSDFSNTLKKKFGITSASSTLIDLISSKNELKKFVKSVSNIKMKGSDYTEQMILDLFANLKMEKIIDYEDDKLQYLINDYQNKNSIIKQVKELKSSTITVNEEIEQVEENTEALKILQKFHNKKTCVVCDHDGIEPNQLIKQKEDNRLRIVNLVDEKLKNMINQMIDESFNNDVFNIKESLIETISTGEINILYNLKKTINAYEILYETLLNNSFIECLSNCDLKSAYNDYALMIDKKPEINEEDLLYIQEVVNNSMSKKLKLARDENKNIKIFLADREFINRQRDELPLSSGEQNFLSLTFEFLKAKKSQSSIIVIDDPISSFDSIYKNKVVYSLMKILDNKFRIVLTHNLDLVRLISAQYKNSFNLYILNNCNEGSQNGFIKLNNKEQKILINLKELLSMFRKDIKNYIVDDEAYLISMIPFMRGYASITGDDDSYNKLTDVMHGYKINNVDLAEIYIKLFQTNLEGVIPNHYSVNVSVILSKNFDNIQIVKEMPILDKTLRHSAIYLVLRLSVEKTLVEKFKVDTTVNKQLGQIISQAFPEDGDLIQIRNRVFFTSKKTLINEFNHFEGNLSIFQPAIDITDQALAQEKSLIEGKIRELKE